MKKGFERPSVKNVEVASMDGVSVVTDVVTEHTPKEGGLTSKYVKYNEVPTDLASLNCFKSAITGRVSNAFLSTSKETIKEFVFPLNITRMLSLRFRLVEVKELIKKKLETNALIEIRKKRMANDDDAEALLAGSIISKIQFAHNKDKEFIAILDKNIVLKKEVSNPSLLEQMQVDPSKKIDYDMIPGYIKSLAAGQFEVKHYGDDLVVVLDIDKVMSSVLLSGIINGDNDAIASTIKIGKTVQSAGGFLNVAIAVEGVANFDNSVARVKESQFVCGRFQFTHDQLRNMLVGPGKDLTVSCEQSSDIIFVRTADIAGQPTGAEALKIQSAGSPNVSLFITVPLIKISKSVFTKKYKNTGNPLLDSLIQNSSKAELVDTQNILSKFQGLLDGQVFSFNVGLSSGQDLAILPNYRNLVAAALFGYKSLTDGKMVLPKLDVTDNGHSIGVVVTV